MNVLIVDDQAVNRLIARTHLERAGATVEEAADGPAALARLASGRFDAVLLDVGLPGMGGADVCAAVRAEPRLAGLRVLAWTAGDEDALGALLAAGFDGLLAKPLRRDALLAALGLAPPG